MRPLALGGALAALAAGAFMPVAASRHLDDFGPIVMSRAAHREEQPPRTNGKRPSARTTRSRRDGQRRDPFYGIASKGRLGARARMRAMEASRLAMTRHSRGTSNPFKLQRRKDAFDAALKAGRSRNDAMKIARRVAA